MSSYLEGSQNSAWYFVSVSYVKKHFLNVFLIFSLAHCDTRKSVHCIRRGTLASRCPWGSSSIGHRALLASGEERLAPVDCSRNRQSGPGVAYSSCPGGKSWKGAEVTNGRRSREQSGIVLISIWGCGKTQSPWCPSSPLADRDAPPERAWQLGPSSKLRPLVLSLYPQVPWSSWALWRDVQESAHSTGGWVYLACCCGENDRACKPRATGQTAPARNQQVPATDTGASCRKQRKGTSTNGIFS